MLLMRYRASNVGTGRDTITCLDCGRVPTHALEYNAKIVDHCRQTEREERTDARLKGQHGR